MRSPNPLVKVNSGSKFQPDGAAVPARPTGQAALSAAWNRRKSTTPFHTSRGKRRCASRGATLSLIHI
eukprot:12980322-Alexandrium_andersonii.AAC.1